MNKNRYGFVVGGLFVVWTAVILLLSLVPGDELPPAGWLARIPHFDKIVHCGFLSDRDGLARIVAPSFAAGKVLDRGGSRCVFRRHRACPERLRPQRGLVRLGANALGAMAGVPAAIWLGKRIDQGTRASRK
ncbi:MAG: hypothetical protein ACLR76_11845 [Alistipes sp.]